MQNQTNQTNQTNKKKKILIIKLSSLGDLIHTFPALSQAQKNHPDYEFDWLVDSSLSDVPKLHPDVKTIISLPLRAWAKNKLNFKKFKNLIRAVKNLRAQKYDLVLDAQGLIKSGILTFLTRADLTIGLDKNSAKEGLASFFYHKKIQADKNQHAIDKLRILFSESLSDSDSCLSPGGRDTPEGAERGLREKNDQKFSQKTILFLHGTTWATKHWPNKYWIKLGQDLNQAGFKILLPWGSDQEKNRAEYFAQNFKAEVLPRLSIGELAELMTHKITGIIALDSGLTHLAAFLNIPTVSLYGPTDPYKTGARGFNQKILQASFNCAPCLAKTCAYQGVNPDPEIFPACFSSIPPTLVYDALLNLLKKNPGENLI